MEATITAAIVAAMITAIKVIDVLVDKFIKSDKGEKGTVTVVLDPEISRIVHETRENTAAILQICTTMDQDGIPMVYTPRSLVNHQEKILDVCRQISYSQEKVVETCEKLVDRVDEGFDDTETQLKQAIAMRRNGV